MKGIDAQFLDNLKTRLGIVEVIEKYVRLEQRGKNFWGCCPFHHEKTPSFCVNSQENFYHCFGCGKSGDIITFLMEEEGFTFIEAVSELCKMAKIPMPEIDYDSDSVKRQRERKERLLNLLKESAKYYVSNLSQEASKNHYDYLKKRGVNDEIIKKFGIGSSQNAKGIINHLKGLGYTELEMVDAGVAGKKDDYYYDFLRERVIIPVINQFDNVVAFCGRILEAKGVGKYVNSKETEVFKKGKMLFNINNLKKIKQERELDTAILVEGHMDVISLTAAGFDNVVASMGTALTDDQARLISRYVKNVLISYDGDSAGQMAAIKGVDILAKQGLNVKVVCIPNGQDPDDVIKSSGQAGYKKLLEEALPLTDFKLHVLESKTDFSKLDQKRKYIKQALMVIKQSESFAEQEELLKKLSKKVQITYETLLKDMNEKSYEYVEQKSEVIKKVEVLDPIIDAERVILWALIFNKPYFNGVDITRIKFTKAEHSSIFQQILNTRLQSETQIVKNLSPHMLFETLDESLQEDLSKIIEYELEEKGIEEERYVKDCVTRVLKEGIQREIDKLQKQFNLESDIQKKSEILKTIQSKIKEKGLIK